MDAIAGMPPLAVPAVSPGRKQMAEILPSQSLCINDSIHKANTVGVGNKRQRGEEQDKGLSTITGKPITNGAPTDVGHNFSGGYIPPVAESNLDFELPVGTNKCRMGSKDDEAADDVLWDSFYSQLVDFATRNGHTHVPQTSENETEKGLFSLRQWVMKQRYEYKLYSLRKKLTTLPTQKGEPKSGDLIEDCEINRNFPGLGDVEKEKIKNQEHLFNQIGSMTEERIEKLEKIGFEWSEQAGIATKIRNSKRKSLSIPLPSNKHPLFKKSDEICGAIDGAKDNEQRSDDRKPTTPVFANNESNKVIQQYSAHIEDDIYENLTNTSNTDFVAKINSKGISKFPENEYELSKKTSSNEASLGEYTVLLDSAYAATPFSKRTMLARKRSELLTSLGLDDLSKQCKKNIVDITGNMGVSKNILSRNDTSEVDLEATCNHANSNSNQLEQNAKSPLPVDNLFCAAASKVNLGKNKGKPNTVAIPNNFNKGYGESIVRVHRIHNIVIPSEDSRPSTKKFPNKAQRKKLSFTTNIYKAKSILEIPQSLLL